jgi:deoxyribonuclease IV
MLLGVHCSVAGGVINAFAEAEKLGIDTFQIFTKNQRQWKEKMIEEAEGAQFRAQFKPNGIKSAFSHATYLINLGSTEENLRKNSIMTLAGELMRCDALGLDFTVLHPGAAGQLSEAEAIKQIADGLKIVLDHTPGCKAKILLENTAGQGTSIGHRFTQIQEIIKITESERLGLCLDTCHAFAAGFDIRTKTGCDELFDEIDKTVGLTKLHVIHLNDSKGKLGSRIDRHENIGKGELGTEPFRYIMNNFRHVPKVIETPKEDNWDEINLAVLRELAN